MKRQSYPHRKDTQFNAREIELLHKAAEKNNRTGREFMREAILEKIEEVLGKRE